MGTVHRQLPECPKGQGPISMNQQQCQEAIPGKRRSGSRNKEWELYGNI